MNICYSSKSWFSTEATDFGSKHEKIARDILTEYLSNIHENISVKDSGLFRSEVYPYLVVSPGDIWNGPVVKQYLWEKSNAQSKQQKCHYQNLQ